MPSSDYACLQVLRRGQFCQMANKGRLWIRGAVTGVRGAFRWGVCLSMLLSGYRLNLIAFQLK
jgi:hypothetical protein